MRLFLTGLAVEAAEPLVEVLLILHAFSVLAESEVLVLFSGPLRCRKFHCSTLQPTEDGKQQHLNDLGLQEKGGGGGDYSYVFAACSRVQSKPTVRRVYIHRKPCVSNL